MYLTDEILITKLNGHTTAGTSDVDATGIDMLENGGYDGVLFVTNIGTAAANNSLKAEESADNITYADLAGTSVVSGASPSNEALWLDVYRPQKRYIRPTVLRGTSTTCETIWGIRYRGRNGLNAARNLVSGTQTGVQVASPVAGTP